MWVHERRLHVVRDNERPLNRWSLVSELSIAAILTVDSVLRNPKKRKQVFSGIVDLARDCHEILTSSKNPLNDVVEAMLMDYVGSDSNIVRGRFKGCVNPSECCYPCSAPHLRLVTVNNPIPAKVTPILDGIKILPNG
jgi:hypothetical protein